MSEEQLLNQPGLQPMREKLLRSALEYYQGFVRQRADDPTLRRQLGEAHRRLGEINNDLGNRVEAIAALERAVATFEPLVSGGTQRRPSSPSPWLARCRPCPIAGFEVDNADGGERAARAGIMLLEPLEHDHPEVVEYGRHLGRCYSLLGSADIVRGRTDRSLVAMDQSISVLKRTVSRHPKDVQSRGFLVISLSNRSTGLQGLDDFEGGLRATRKPRSRDGSC